MEWFRDIIAAGIPCGPINTVDQGVAFAEDIGLDPVVDVGPDGASVSPVRNPITLSGTPPRTGSRRLRSTSTAPRSAAGCPRRSRHDRALRVPTSLGTSDADRIRLLGQDLTADLMGQVGSASSRSGWWRCGGRRRRRSGVFEAVLVALADHGFTPTAIAARLAYLSAPDSLQGAGRGLLGGGSRFLGVTEDCGQFLDAVLVDVQDDLPTDDAGWDALALAAVTRTREAGRFVPGLGHPVHKVEDPRTPVLLRIAEEEGLRRPHLRLFEAVGRVHEQVLGRPAAAQRRRVCGAAGRPQACRSSCCAGSPCWPRPPGCSGSSPRSVAGRSAWTSTSPSTAAPT